MHTDERTVADVFSSNGYVTGMVGKWHLGDNAPHRPQDRGFQDVVWQHHQSVADGTENCKYVVLNPHVERGSLLNFEHLRFDYLVSRKLFKQQLSNAGLAGRFGAH